MWLLHEKLAFPSEGSWDRGSCLEGGGEVRWGVYAGWSTVLKLTTVEVGGEGGTWSTVLKLTTVEVVKGRIIPCVPFLTALLLPVQAGFSSWKFWIHLNSTLSWTKLLTKNLLPLKSDYALNLTPSLRVFFLSLLFFGGWVGEGDVFNQKSLNSIFFIL